MIDDRVLLDVGVATARGQRARNEDFHWAAGGVFLVAGTSALVYPAAGLIDIAKGAGAAIIEVNLDETPYSAMVDVSLRGKAGDLLPRLLDP